MIVRAYLGADALTGAACTVPRTPFAMMALCEPSDAVCAQTVIESPSFHPRVICCIVGSTTRYEPTLVSRIGPFTLVTRASRHAEA
jgi:hypothetical protein